MVASSSSCLNCTSWLLTFWLESEYVVIWIERRGYLLLVEFASWRVFAVEEIVDFGEGVDAYLFDEVSEFLWVWGSELSWMTIDDLDELGGGLSEECIELF